MAIQKEIWQQVIIDNLYEGNEFLRYAFNADEYVLAGSVVHIPKAGAKPNVERNRKNLPAEVTKRKDIDRTYAIDEFTTDPIHISDAEKVELAYDKINNVLGEHMEALREVTGDWAFYNWLTSLAGAQILRTSGTSVSGHLDGTTGGNRKKFVKEDLSRAQTLMNKKSIPKSNRFAAMSSDMLEQLKDDPDLKKRDNALELNIREGAIGRLYGFDIFERASIATFSNASPPTVKEPGAAAASADNDGVVCWQQNAVEKALGTVDVFENLNDPQWYGDIYSALVRFGGDRRRDNGVVAIVQDHV